MIGKYFLLAFVCVSLGQVLGDELENAILKGLVKANALYERGIRRIENVEKYKTEIVETKANRFIENVQRVHENSKRTLNRAAQNAEEKAKETDKPDSVFQCIARAEKNANNQIEISVKKFRPFIERLQNIYGKKVELAASSLAEIKDNIKGRYENARVQIKACKTERCVEIAVSNFSASIDRFFEAVGNVQNQINGILRNFEREARSVFNNTNRQISATQAAGLRQIRACVYRRDQF